MIFVESYNTSPVKKQKQTNKQKRNNQKKTSICNKRVRVDFVAFASQIIFIITGDNFSNEGYGLPSHVILFKMS